MEALTYNKTEQAPYPPPGEPSIDTLEAIAQSTVEELTLSPALIYITASRKQGTPGVLPESF